MRGDDGVHEALPHPLTMLTKHVPRTHAHRRSKAGLRGKEAQDLSNSSSSGTALLILWAFPRLTSMQPRPPTRSMQSCMPSEPARKQTG